MTKIKQEIILPDAVRHRLDPYISPENNDITVAEINGKVINGYSGYYHLYTALVPYRKVNTLLKASGGGLDSSVTAWGPYPATTLTKYDRPFWIQGTKGNSVYEPLVHAWSRHDRVVMQPDTAFLMCYGLVPRFLQDGVVHWDDRSKPEYDIVSVKAESQFTTPSNYTNAFIKIQRDYLEDYLSLKECAAIATFEEERLSNEDPIFEELIGKEKAIEIKLPGYTLYLRRVDPKLFNGASQLIQLTGTQLIMRPQQQLITNSSVPLLVWPGREEPVTPNQALSIFGPINEVYIKDTVLTSYEDKEEFDIHPESGGLSYGGWWSVSRSERYGRNHLKIELRKLYEGVPESVTRVFNRYAVSEAEAKIDFERYGERHIGDRAAEFIEAYLLLVDAILDITNKCGITIEQTMISGLPSRAEILYQGWWMLSDLKSIAEVVPVDISESIFLRRCVNIYKILEQLKPGALKKILLKLGVPDTEIRDMGSIKLLATLMQLVIIALRDSLHLVDDFSVILPRWSKDMIVPSMSPIFALIQLRILESHPAGRKRRSDLERASGVFGIDLQAAQTGWGVSLDKVYDQIIASLSSIAQDIQQSTS